jgi:hypothetical protein
MRMHDCIAQTGISGECFTAGNEGEELLIWNRGELSRASPFHADTVSTIYQGPLA